MDTANEAGKTGRAWPILGNSPRSNSPEMEYAASANTLLANQRKTKTWGFIASEAGPEGIHTSRMDFIGRGRSLWSPRLLETLDFLEPRDTAPYPTFDPIGAILVGATLPPRSSQTFKFLVGFARNRDAALDTVKRFLSPQPSAPVPADAKRKKRRKTFSSVTVKFCRAPRNPIRPTRPGGTPWWFTRRLRRVPTTTPCPTPRGIM
ncbi:MAG: hypothetical protein IPN23_11235 [Elusimicrobia bacterium]|nr:hypothetical protein [Elusimicrobiota bacterium]